MNGANEVSIVHAFGAEGDSAEFSSGPLIEAADGSLYGTAGGEHFILGGGGSPGTIFRLSYKTDQTISFAPLANKTFGDADFVVSATATSGLAVTFVASGTCTISGATVHLTAAGNCTITASQAGNSDYNPAPNVSRSFVIATPAVTLTLSPASVTGGTSATATVTLTSPAPNGGAVVNLSSSAPGVAGTSHGVNHERQDHQDVHRDDVGSGEHHRREHLRVVWRNDSDHAAHGDCRAGSRSLGADVEPQGGQGRHFVNRDRDTDRGGTGRRARRHADQLDTWCSDDRQRGRPGGCDVSDRDHRDLSGERHYERYDHGDHWRRVAIGNADRQKVNRRRLASELRAADWRPWLAAA